MRTVVEGGPKVQAATRRQRKRIEIDMDLGEIISGIAGVRVTGRASTSILGLACDSRKVTRDSLFFALPGAKANGNEFVASAIERGAIAVASPLPRLAGIVADIAWVELMPGEERRTLALAAANFYRHPADALQLVGVTGTNGKTTITFIVDSILRAAGMTTARIGTTGYQTPKGFRPARNTTPESLDLQQMFAEVRDAGGTHAVLEVSSHALAMERTWGCHFAVAIFTNLTRDHLNFHKTFEEYFAAKRVLFEGTGAGAPDTAVINLDDAYAPRLEASGEAYVDLWLEGKRGSDCAKVFTQFRGAGIHGADAGGQSGSALVAGGAHQCLQHSGGDWGGHRAGYSGGEDRRGHREPGAGAGKISAD